MLGTSFGVAVLTITLLCFILGRRLIGPRRVLVLGSGLRAAELRRRLAEHNSFRPQAPTPETVNRIWGIVIAENVTHENIELLINQSRGVPIYSDLAFQERHLGRVAVDSIDANWLLNGLQNQVALRLERRIFDLVVGTVLVIATFPIMAIFAILIKLDSRGPVFYRQERIGLHGEPFTLYKFRSMTNDAEACGRPQWATKRDPRVTRIGSIMRACRIDELPQLINVLRGEMSMIGPRPERTAFVDRLAKLIPFYNHRGCVKPGLTGWAQVNYPYGASVDDAREKLAYDLYYIKNRTLLLDILILLATIRVVLFREGAC